MTEPNRAARDFEIQSWSYEAKLFYDKHYSFVFKMIHKDWKSWDLDEANWRGNLVGNEMGLYDGTVPVELVQKSSGKTLQKKSTQSLEHIVPKASLKGLVNIMRAAGEPIVETTRAFIKDLNILCYTTRDTNTIRYNYTFDDIIDANRKGKVKQEHCYMRENKYTHKTSKGCDQFNHLPFEGKPVGYTGNGPSPEGETAPPIRQDQALTVTFDKNTASKSKNKLKRYIDVDRIAATQQIVRAIAHARDQYTLPVEFTITLPTFTAWVGIPVSKYEYVNAYVIFKQTRIPNRWVLLDPIFNVLMVKRDPLNDEYEMFIGSKNNVEEVLRGKYERVVLEQFGTDTAAFMDLLMKRDDVQKIIERVFKHCKKKLDEPIASFQSLISRELATIVNDFYKELTSRERIAEDEYNRKSGARAYYYRNGGKDLTNFLTLYPPVTASAADDDDDSDSDSDDFGAFVKPLRRTR